MACQVCKEFDNQSRINGPVQGKATLRSAEPELLLSHSVSIMFTSYRATHYGEITNFIQKKNLKDI